MLNVVNVSDLGMVSDLQVEESWVEYSCQDELDNIRLALSRKIGMPEPVLYEDADLEAEDLSRENGKEASKGDWERDLWALIDLQERMAKGMKLIDECNLVLEKAKSGNRRLPYKVFMSWVERRRKLWNHWKGLLAESRTLVGDNDFLWGKYFELVTSVEDRTGYSSDLNLQYVEDLDNQVVWNTDSVDDYLE